MQEMTRERNIINEQDITIERLTAELDKLRDERDDSLGRWNQVQSLISELDAERVKVEKLRDALTKIAEESNVLMGNGDYDTVPALTDYDAQSLARLTLTETENTK